jgi:N-methylhydantoinase A/oxoprolinase/acetone carboxylase beta subunit
MNGDGNVERPLNREVAADVADKIADAGIKSIAIAFINAYVNDAHEQEMQDIVRARIPDLCAAAESIWLRLSGVTLTQIHKVRIVQRLLYVIDQI